MMIINLFRACLWAALVSLSGSSSGPIVYGLQPDCDEDDQTRYNICLDLTSSSQNYEAWMEAFKEARDRWEEIIVEDDGPVTRTWDDCMITGEAKAIDGVGGVIGSASPRLLRSHSGHWHTLEGSMTFDEADIQDMINKGLWTSVVLHEMGHVLGIGSLWYRNDLQSYKGHDGRDDEYRGNIAQDKWEEIGCSGDVPVETDGGYGTAGGHWDEACMDDELMTGWLDSKMYISAITIGSLEDMGYGVDYSTADPFGLDNLFRGHGRHSTHPPERKTIIEQGRRARDAALRGPGNGQRPRGQEIT
jgi:hypothetical protein